MLISLIRCINDKNIRYKYLPLRYCCDKMRLNPMLDLTSECDENNYVFCDECEERWNPWADCDKKCGIRIDSKTFELPHIKMFRQVYDEDDFPVNESISIKYCPHCGEKIDICVAGEIDITNQKNWKTNILWLKKNTINVIVLNGEIYYIKKCKKLRMNMVRSSSLENANTIKGR